MMHTFFRTEPEPPVFRGLESAPSKCDGSTTLVCALNTGAANWPIGYPSLLNDKISGRPDIVKLSVYNLVNKMGTGY